MTRILYTHDVPGNESSFSAWLDIIGSRGLVVRSASEVLSQGSQGGSVGLMFDDGLRSTLEAARVLADRGWTATFAVILGTLQDPIEVERKYLGSEPLLSRADCREIIELGHEIAAHGWTHRRLSDLDAAEAQREISLCQETIEQFDQDVVGFVLPHGQSSAYRRWHVEEVHNKGFHWVASTVWGTAGQRHKGAVCRCHVGGLAASEIDAVIRGRKDWRSAWHRTGGRFRSWRPVE